MGKNRGEPVPPENNFPNIAWNWAKADYNPAWHEPIFELMARYVAEGSRVLEVGAGGSHTLGALAGRMRCRAFGLEPDTDGIAKTFELARDEAGTIEMIRGDGFCLPFDSGEFDVVYSLGLVEHFVQKESMELIAEHARVCKPGGSVIVAVPNYLNFPHTFRKFLMGTLYEYYPERSYTPRQLISMLKSNDLTIEAVDGVLPLWGVAMFSGGWRVTALLSRLGFEHRLNNLKSGKWRARLGYMTYAAATKPKH